MTYRPIEEYITQIKEDRQRHLNLEESCVEIGTNSVSCRGLLAHYLKTTVPKRSKIQCCHACHNAACSNPRHLYWGTPAENAKDLYDTPLGDLLRKNLSDRMRGKCNPSLLKRPWDNPNVGENHWWKAQEVFDQRPASTGKKNGSYRLMKLFDLPQGTSKTMTKMFAQGWIPKEDPEWLQFFAGVAQKKRPQT